MKDITNVPFKKIGEIIPNIPHGKQSPFFKSGFHALDDIIGGFKPGNLYLIGGHPAMGKTMLILDMAINIAMSTLKPVYIFSLELCEWRIFKYLISKISSLDFSIVRNQNVNHFPKKQGRCFVRSINSLPIYICDKIKGLYELVETMQTEITDGIVFIDGLQEIDIKRNCKKFQPQGKESENLPLITCEEISAVLKQVAGRKHLPIVITSQLSRAIEYREDRRPALTDIQDDYIVKNTDAVIFIYRENYYYYISNTDGIDMDDAELIVAKSNQGFLGTALIRFNRQDARFTNQDN